MAGLLLSAAAMAQAPLPIDIAPQRLDRALNALAAQTGVQIIFSSAAAEAHAAPSVKGSLSTREALQRLLAGSGLQLSERSDGVFVVVDSAAAGASAGDAKTLGEVKVVGRLLDTLSMMKRGETLRDTPQAVTIMTSQRIEEQKLVTISEVLTQAPGVTVENDFFGRPNSYYSRGFAITNMQVDGTSIDVGRSYYFNPNLAAYEQVEVLRGADDRADAQQGQVGGRQVALESGVAVLERGDGFLSQQAGRQGHARSVWLVAECNGGQSGAERVGIETWRQADVSPEAARASQRRRCPVVERVWCASRRRAATRWCVEAVANAAGAGPQPQKCGHGGVMTPLL